jgi:hypothetical protein
MAAAKHAFAVERLGATRKLHPSTPSTVPPAQVQNVDLHAATAGHRSDGMSAKYDDRGGTHTTELPPPPLWLLTFGG